MTGAMPAERVRVGRIPTEADGCDMMTESETALVSAAMAGSLLAAGHAHAQQGQQDLSVQEVQSFFHSMEQEVMQAMRSGEYARLLDWTENALAEGATFFLSQEIYVGDERKGFAVTSLDKQDMLRLSRVAVGIVSEMQGQAVQDYALDIEVINVDPIGPNAATAATRITESGKLALPGEEDPQQPRLSPIEIEATAECHHLIQRDRDAGELVMGMTSCEARTRL